MSHEPEEWTDRLGRRRMSCAECEEAWPCESAPHGGRPRGYLRGGDAGHVVAEVAHGFGVSVDEIMGDGRQPHVCMARACAMAVLRTWKSEWSWPTIGTYFSRDQSTVRGAVARVMADPELRRDVERVVDVLRPPPRLFAVRDEDAKAQ